jgi:hypothetical protein
VVGNDVHHDAHTVGAGFGSQGLELVAPTHDGADAPMIDDVVPVGGPRGGGEDRRQVEVGDPEAGQVGD